MQEDIEHRTVTLAVSTAKFTGRALKEAITRYTQHIRTQKQKNTPTKSGRVTMKQLQRQYGDLRSVTVDDANTRQFERVARKYHVQYKVYRCEKGKYQIFFKSPSDEAMQTAFREFTTKKLQKANCPSVLEQLKTLAAGLVPAMEKEKRRERER